MTITVTHETLTKHFWKRKTAANITIQQENVRLHATKISIYFTMNCHQVKNNIQICAYEHTCMHWLKVPKRASIHAHSILEKEKQKENFGRVK